MGSPSPTERSEFGRNVYVASLPLDFDDQQLFDLFAQYGPISSARIMRKKGTRESKGYGFILYKNVASAALAISSLSGGIIGGSRIQVRLAHPDASTAYNSQRTSKSSNSTPGARSLQAAHPPPASPLQLPLQPQPPQMQTQPPQPQLQPQAQLQLQPQLQPHPPTLGSTATANPTMMMAPVQLSTLYPTMYSPTVFPVMSPTQTPSISGGASPQLMLVPQFTSQSQQVTSQPTFYMLLPDNVMPNPALV
ncbi:RNA-binding protein 5, putative [Trypanosoma cruzi marinkellei]|uniref:RNA-binding protein 5, putative n=1 Tax=Trypanosoma cruzi marinkellei TaxID=85056 RepID=K2MYU7_TRYCR|nr:RNA-binding protein 5, putative [Trypanosoma cruzi marinkellei]